MKRRKPKGQTDLVDYERLCYELRPCDVVLISGTSRVSDVIKVVTQSRWSHAAIYLGRIHDIEDPEIREKVLSHYSGSLSEPLIIESELGKGTVVSPLAEYRGYHIRICRPRGLSRHDARKVIAYCVNHIGRYYDVRQVLDLARFLFPYSILPRKWRSSLFRHNAGIPTKESCSLLIAEAFASVNFPILPYIRKNKEGNFKFIKRNPRLYVPTDFDSSPYFDIIKYPIFESAHVPIYQSLPWQDNMMSDHDGNVYQVDKTRLKMINPDEYDQPKKIEQLKKEEDKDKKDE